MTIAASAWLGTLPMWLVFFGVLGLAFALRGGQLGPAVGYLREANKVLEQENVTLKAQLREAHRDLIEARARTDLAPMQVAVLDALTGHETRAQERFEQTTHILGLIAKRLGPETS